MNRDMTVEDASTELLNGELLSNGRFIVVEFDEDGPCSWMSGNPVEVEP
jgi:hypothetical protein